MSFLSYFRPRWLETRSETAGTWTSGDMRPTWKNTGWKRPRSIKHLWQESTGEGSEISACVRSHLLDQFPPTCPCWIVISHGWWMPQASKVWDICNRGTGREDVQSLLFGPHQEEVEVGRYPCQAAACIDRRFEHATAGGTKNVKAEWETLCRLGTVLDNLPRVRILCDGAGSWMGTPAIVGQALFNPKWCVGTCPFLV